MHIPLLRLVRQYKRVSFLQDRKINWSLECKRSVFKTLYNLLERCKKTFFLCTRIKYLLQTFLFFAKNINKII